MIYVNVNVRKPVTRGYAWSPNLVLKECLLSEFTCKNMSKCDIKVCLNYAEDDKLSVLK